ncbi:hypothetical protein ES705_18243 [subsurface metagenome]
MNKINNIKIAKYFYLYEFQCPCCKRVILHSDLLKRLNSLREAINRPIYINSGYRCKDENEEVGGVPGSFHKLGMAADIWAKDINIVDLMIYAQGVGFNGIGKYKRFLHLDVRDTKYFWEG